MIAIFAVGLIMMKRKRNLSYKVLILFMNVGLCFKSLYHTLFRVDGVTMILAGFS